MNTNAVQCTRKNPRNIILLAVILISHLIFPSAAFAATINVPANYIAVNRGLAGWWTFDGRDTPWSSATAATTLDKSSNGNTGTLTNMNRVTALTPGKVGQTVNFDGIDDYVAINPSIGNLSSGMTVSAWINRAAGGAMQIMGNYDGNNGTANLINGWNFEIGDAIGDELDLYYNYHGGSNYVGKYSNVDVPVGQWVHVAGTWDGTIASGAGFNLYINGAAVATTDYSGGTVASYANSTRDLEIGRWLFGAGYGGYFNGKIDDVRTYNRVLSTSEIKQLYMTSAGNRVNVSMSPGTISTSLIGWWTFDGSDTPWSSATAATTLDKSNNGNTGTLTNMNRSTSPVAGILGQGLSFDGINEYIDTVDNPLDVTGDITVAFWLYPKDGINENIPLGKYSVSDDAGWYFDLNDPSGIYFGGRTGIGSNSTSGLASYTLNKWQHVVGKRSGTTWSIYIDGVLANSTAGDAGSFANTVSMQIGGASDANIYLRGFMDDVRIYSRALSDLEISQLYHLGKR